MKRMSVLFSVALLLFLLAACGGGSDGVQEPEAGPPDLTGTWKQVNSNSEDSWQSATISGETIEIYWVSDNGDTQSLYWAGTFTAPATADEPYSWDSENDKGKTDTALLASGDDTKTFTYEGGQISYSASALGTTMTIKLEKTAAEPDKSTEDGSEQKISGESPEFLPLELKEHGYAVNGDYLYYAFILHNPNEQYAVEFPTVRITARDANGLVMGTGEQVLSIIYPGQDFAYGGLGFEISEQPGEVEMEVVAPDDYKIKLSESLEHPAFVPLEVSGVNMRETKVLGEIKNANDYDIEQAIVTVIFRDDNGNIMSGECTFVDKIASDGSIPFELRANSGIVTDKFEVYANSW